jgi:thiol-disulfide isomerase/thioredoxin
MTPLLSLAAIACEPMEAAAPDSGVTGETILDLRYAEISNGALSGEKSLVELAEQAPVFVNLWATWCVPCREEVVELGRIHQSHPGLIIVGIDEKDELATATEFIQENDMRYTVLFDPAGEAMDGFDAFALPANFLFDKGGKRRWFRYGMITSDEPALIAEIEAALEAP